MGALDEIRTAAQDFLSEESQNKIQDQLSKILKKEPTKNLTLVFCGTFSSGKSSLINELLHSKFKLPTGPNPVTKFVTRLKYAKKFSACYVWHDKEYPLHQTDLEDILTGKLHLPDESLEVLIRLPAKILRGGVEILDTPGYLDNQELTELTRSAVATADIAFFCCNAAVAGRKFEVDYFQELEDTIGNTDEDFERIRSFMEGNIAGRGRAILCFLDMEKLFFTTAGGKRIDLGEFNKFFSLLCINLSKKFQRRLQRYAYQKRTIHELKMLGDYVQNQIHCSEYFYSCANIETRSEHQKTRKNFLAECKKISEHVEDILTYGKKILEDAIKDIEREFDSLEAKEYCFNFRDKATDYLRNRLQKVPTALRTRLKEIFPVQNFDDKNFFADYNAIVNNYSVPEPVGKRVEKNETNNLLSSVWSAIRGKSKTKEYETVFENYAADAKEHLRNHLLDQLQAVMTKYFRSLENAMKPTPPSKDDALIEELIACKRKWEMLYAEIVKYLNFCHEKFMWGLDKDKKFFPILT